LYKWVAVLAYLAVALLCAGNVRRSITRSAAAERRSGAKARRRFWRVLAILLLLLGAFHLVDLPWLAAEGVRALTGREVGSDQLGGFATGLIGVTGGFASVGLITAFAGLRRAEGTILAAMAGSFALVIVTLARTMSVHHVEDLADGGLNLGWAPVGLFAELGVLGWIGIAGHAFLSTCRNEGRTAHLRAVSRRERRRLRSRGQLSRS
jgi:hypothetical protein